MHRAEVLRLLDARAIHAVLAQHRPRGARALRAALATLATDEPELTRSALEEAFLALVAAAGLPRPRLNARVAGLEVDFLWPEHRLAVETDGAAAHLTPRAFAGDRRRDQVLAVHGLRTLRFTHGQVVHGPREVAATLRAVLPHRSPRPG